MFVAFTGANVFAAVKNLLVIFVSWSVCRVMACDVVWFMAKGNVWHMVCAKTREATLCFLMIIITFATAKN